MESDNIAHRLIHALWPMVAVSLIFMLLRFSCKYWHGKKFAVDDGILAFAWICHLVYAAVITESTNHGMGRHIATLSRDEEFQAHRLLAVSYLFATVSAAASKSSFAITLLHLSQEIWEKVFLWFIVITVNLTLGISDIFLFVSCSPIEKIFDPRTEGTCLNGKMLHQYNTFSAAYSTGIDFVLVAYPWYLMWGMNMRKVEKLGICIAMSFGVLSGVTGIVRIVYMQNGVKWKDWTHYSTDVLIWLAAETALIIVAASIPFLRGLLKEIGKRTISSKSGGGSSNGQFSLGTVAWASNPSRSVPGHSWAKNFSASEGDPSGISDSRSGESIHEVLQESGKNGVVLMTRQLKVDSGGRDDAKL